MAPLPLLFIVLSSTALLLALVALWSSLRQALGAANGEVGPALETAELPGRAALLDEKKSLLRAIKDLEYEHAVGKISPDDFKRLDLAYRVRAKEVISLLEQDLAPYQARAEALLSQHVAAATKDVAAKDADAEDAKRERAERQDAERQDAKADEASLRERARALRAEAERLERMARESSDEDTKSEDAKSEDTKGEDAKGEDAKGEQAKGEDAEESDA